MSSSEAMGRSTPPVVHTPTGEASTSDAQQATGSLAKSTETSENTNWCVTFFSQTLPGVFKAGWEKIASFITDVVQPLFTKWQEPVPVGFKWLTAPFVGVASFITGIFCSCCGCEKKSTEVATEDDQTNGATTVSGLGQQDSTPTTTAAERTTADGDQQS